MEMRPRSWAVLRLLAEHAGRLVGKDDIIAKVWDDVAVTEDSLTQCIVDIRKAIGDEEASRSTHPPAQGLYAGSLHSTESSWRVAHRIFPHWPSCPSCRSERNAGP